MYIRAVQITNRYLGTASDRFMARQVENHLHKSPDDLSPADLLNLIDWIRVTASLFIEDNELIEAYTNALQKLAQSSANESKSSHR
jgi:hypothetical protein